MKGFQPLEKVRSRRIPLAQGRLTFRESGVIVPQLIDSLYYLIISETRPKHKPSKKDIWIGHQKLLLLLLLLKIIITVDAIATTVTNKFLCLLYVTRPARLWDTSLHLVLRDMVTHRYQQYYSERDKTHHRLVPFAFTHGFLLPFHSRLNISRSEYVN